MFHDSSATTVGCPNCGHPATLNYCAQCGQKTHLHKDTFWGLITHFVGDYFHYDSKFWKTLKALWTAPGTLTKAYAEEKRARYIPPVSLYIFVSAVFFIVNAVLPAAVDSGKVKGGPVAVGNSGNRSTASSLDTSRVIAINLPAPTSIRHLSARLKQLDEAPEEQQKEIGEKFEHQFPKLFFLMIPVTAFLLTLAFARRKGTYFVHHAIFSLHVHSFFFSLFLLEVLNPFDRIDTWLTIGLLTVFTLYFIAALRRVYAIGYLRAILTTLFVGFIYTAVAFIAFLAIVLYVLSHI